MTGCLGGTVPVSYLSLTWADSHSLGKWIDNGAEMIVLVGAMAAGCPYLKRIYLKEHVLLPNGQCSPNAFVLWLLGEYNPETTSRKELAGAIVLTGLLYLGSSSLELG